MKNIYYNKNNDEVLKLFSTSKKGLAGKVVLEKQKEFGFNELPKAKQKGVFSILFDELCEPIVIILLLTVVISLFTRCFCDTFYCGN